LPTRREAQQERTLRAEAEVTAEALRNHISRQLHFYYQAIWARSDANWIRERVRELGLPLGMLETRFYGFEFEFAALKVVNLDLAVERGFSRDGLDHWRKRIDDGEFKKELTVTVPTGHLFVEPRLGVCDGADLFVRQHRDIDLSRAQAEVDRLKAEAEQAGQEALRLRQRIAVGDLTDPRPFAHVRSIALEFEARSPLPET
jgi:hypothetical protein